MRTLDRIYKSAWTLLLLMPWATQPAHADERILSFDSTITVNRDGTLEVRETLQVRVEGREIRRGIVREFPTVYPREGGGLVTVGFAFQAATRDGVVEPWRTEPFNNGVRVYVGSPSGMAPLGVHTYEFVYRTDRQMGYFADHDELYWNVTGNGSVFPIDRATARVLLPDDVPRGDIRLEAYTGPHGAKGAAYTAALDNGAPLFSTTQGLRPREGLTIVAMWPKGFIMPPVESAQGLSPRAASPGYGSQDSGGPYFDSPAEAFLRHPLPRDNRPIFFGLTGLALLIGYYYFIWNRVGRDPPGRVIIPEYELPKDLSPAAVRYLVQGNSYDNKCFAAAILSLAVKGRLRIEQSAGILGFGKKFTLTRESSPPDRPLLRDEQALLEKLFQRGDTLELEQKNHRRVSGARSAHESALSDKYRRGFFVINGGWHFLGIVLSILVIIVTMSQPGAEAIWPQWYFTHPLGWLTAACAVCALVANGIFGWLLRAPTVVGQVALDHIRGFRMYLEVAEGEELKRLAAPPPKLTPQLYEAYLPAALALGVEQRWAERFARELVIEPENYQPAWYAGPGWNPASLGVFTSQLGSSLSSAISSSSHAPGSHSGGGGGGSSGGGGGGGRVGGW